MNIICENWVISFMKLKAPNHKTSNNFKKNLIKKIIFKNIILFRCCMYLSILGYYCVILLLRSKVFFNETKQNLIFALFSLKYLVPLLEKCMNII